MRLCSAPLGYETLMRHMRALKGMRLIRRIRAKCKTYVWSGMRTSQRESSGVLQALQGSCLAAA